MANKLNPELVKNISDLMTVKKISDLPIIDVIDKDNETTKIRTSKQFNNSYLLSSTLLEDNSYVGGRYFNYRVKLNEVTEYLSTLSDANLAAFKQTFNFFVDSLKNNTENSYVQFAPANDTIDTENADNNYSYTFRYKLSEVLDDVIGFTYNITSEGIEEISTYSYTNVLTEGLVTNVTLEKYVRNSIANILGVPSTPAAVSEAIDSVIEFVEWFKGYVRNDTEYGSLQNLINTIESKDAKVLDSAYSYVIKNKELSYAYTETSYNLLYSTIQNIDVDVPVKGVSTINKITIGNVTYILDLDDNKNLQLSVDIDNFVPFSVSASGSLTTDNEFYTYINEKNDITLTATANKDCNWNNWTTTSINANTGQSTQSNNGKTLTATGEHNAIGYCTSDKTFYWNVSASHTPTGDEQAHGHTDIEESGTKTVSIKYTFKKYKSAVFASTQDINNIIISETNYQPNIQFTNGGVVKTSSSLESFSSFNVNSSNGDCYIYFLLPSNWVVSGKGFKWTGSEGMAETPGQANIRTLKLYNETKNYTLFRSENKYPSGTDINFKYV